MINLIQIVFAILGIGFVWGAVLAFYTNIKLLKYLKRKNHKKWKEFTMNQVLGIGAVKPGYLTYLAKNDEKDPKIIRYKFFIRNYLKISLTSLVLAIAWMFISYFLIL